jgi:hypothetical protein
MAEWDETDLTPAEVRAIWEAATPADQVHVEVTAASVRVTTGRTETAAPARLVDVHWSTPLRALAPAYQ